MYRFILLNIISISILSSKETDLPEVIDFGKLRLVDCYYHKPGTTWSERLGRAAYNAGITAFNDAPELEALFIMLADDYKIDTVIETGTYFTATTRFFSLHFNDVHTVDIQESLYTQAKALFYEDPNVHCYLGSSEKILHEILPSLKDKRVLFYLDAHWNDFWPLLDELEEISKTHRDNCIIAIDDFKVPGRNDIEFDQYGTHECSYAYIKSKLEKVFTQYSIHYIIPKNTYNRAKLLALPREITIH